MKSDMPRGFNWLTVLTKLSENGKISGDRHSQLCTLAGSWPTCACGQLCEALPRDHLGRPKDFRLAQWGTKFAEYVDESKWCLALETFKKIEHRTAGLLEEMNQKNVSRSLVLR